MHLKNKKAKVNTTLTIVDGIKSIGFALVYFFFIKSKNVIINYPIQDCNAPIVLIFREHER